VRVLLILIVVVLLLALVGWIKFGNTPQQSTISIEKETIKQDAEKMVERGNVFVEDARQAVGTEAGESDGAVGDKTSPPTSAAPPTEPAEPNAQPPAAPNR
jgi:hypothetical protein